MDTTLQVIVAVAAMLFLVYSVGRIIRRQSLLKHKLKAAGLKAGDWTDIEVQGRKASCRFIEAHHNRGREVRPPKIELRLPCKSNGAFQFLRESKSHRFLKAIGFTQDFETGTIVLDQRYFLASPFHDATRRILGDEAVQQAMDQLGSHAGVAEFEHDGEWLLARWTPFRGYVGAAATKFSLAVSPMEAMAGRIPGPYGACDTNQRHR